MTNRFGEFEKLLMMMKGQIESNIDLLEEEMNKLSTEDEIDDGEDMAALMSDSMDHHALLLQQRKELAEVEHALAKIQNGTYGICEKSGEPIPPERLRAEPHARYTIEEAE